MTKRLTYIDIARGIAIICIVLGHLGNNTINRVVFTFHVPIFFFITGYIYAIMSPDSWNRRNLIEGSLCLSETDKAEALAYRREKLQE